MITYEEKSQVVDVAVLCCDLCQVKTRETFNGADHRVNGQGWWVVQRTTRPSEGQADVDLCPRCAKRLLPAAIAELIKGGV